jgi:methionyl aminopeptidase
MITLKNSAQIAHMRRAGRIAGTALKKAGEAITPGMTTAEINDIVDKYIRSCGATPSFFGYGGFPAASCVSVNEEVIHGIPGKKVVKNGDLVKIDVGAFFEGYQSDCACTFPVGEVSKDAKRIIEVVKEAFYEGIKYALPGNRMGDVSAAIQECVEKNGFSVVREYVGHGVGQELHELPDVPNFGIKGRGTRLLEGMTIAIEPMINAGTYDVKVMPNQWTVVTSDGLLSAHYENTIAITGSGVEILTLP